MHPCKILYNIAANGKRYGETEGVCRITGEKSFGRPFFEWVASTFNDWGYLKPGDIISNEALFCFDERSELIRKKTGKDKPQRFRTYSHILHSGKWYCFTKAHKKLIYELIVDNAEIVCLTDTGQKHIFFKHKLGMWQLDESFTKPDIPLFTKIHTTMCDLLRLGFSQAEVKGGDYIGGRIALAGLENWRVLEKTISPHRGSSIFDLAGWMLFISDDDREKIDKMYKALKNKPKKPQKEKEQLCLL